MAGAFQTQKGSPVTAANRRSTPARIVGLAAALILSTAALTGGPASLALAEDVAEDYVVAGNVAPDGTVKLTETLTFANGAMPESIVQRIDTTRDAMDYTFFRYAISDVTAKAGGTDLGLKVADDGDYKVITVDTAKANGQPVEIGYTVKGAAHAGEQVQGGDATTTVEWRVLQGLNVAVKRASGEIVMPGIITSVDCKAGAPAAPQPCSLWAGGTHDAMNPMFQHNVGLGSGQVILFAVGSPASSVTPNQSLESHWTLDRAFSRQPLPLGAALGALALGALALFGLHRMRGRDLANVKEATIVASFVPTGAGQAEFVINEDIRPGHVGTVIDERVDPVDVTATILDLAVRGHLQIVELPAKSAHSPLDWVIERRQSNEDLRVFERTLLDAIAPAGQPGTVVSQISQPIADVIPTVQSQLYDDVVEKGWFAHRPDATRRTWSTLGWIGLVVAVAALVAMMAFTRFGLLGLVLVILGLGLVFVAQEMPRRTAKGAAMFKGLEVLAMNLQTQPISQIPAGKVKEEVSQVLPYAVVLGGVDRWVDALVKADYDAQPDPRDLGWYQAAGDWHMDDLPAALRSFLMSTQGELYGRH